MTNRRKKERCVEEVRNLLMLYLSHKEMAEDCALLRFDDSFLLDNIKILEKALNIAKKELERRIEDGTARSSFVGNEY